MTGESRTEGAENEVETEEESDSEKTHVEAWKAQVETRIGTSYQHASQLLEAVTRTLDGLEDGLVKHAEVIFCLLIRRKHSLCLNDERPHGSY